MRAENAEHSQPMTHDALELDKKLTLNEKARKMS